MICTSPFRKLESIEECRDHWRSVSGQKIKEGRTDGYKVDINSLAKGIYFIQLNNKENITRLKFIKK
ncbi:T9SS type A sorting domain-containing protein [Chryseobacterium sp. 52]|uniref:T9SS type A sorting domain-containing protein n=1 Tax=Chryseobacterium sp. 52 TaxID=2035213 RepID=UPI000C1993CB|nr:T9SS type A sorting domain-containing protein [Chryseobacterium sp. 52]